MVTRNLAILASLHNHVLVWCRTQLFIYGHRETAVSIKQMHFIIDRPAVILRAIAQEIDADDLYLSDDAKQALSEVNAAIARQDKRLGK